MANESRFTRLRASPVGEAGWLIMQESRACLQPALMHNLHITTPTRSREASNFSFHDRFAVEAKIQLSAYSTLKKGENKRSKFSFSQCLDPAPSRPCSIDVNPCNGWGVTLHIIRWQCYHEWKKILMSCVPSRELGWSLKHNQTCVTGFFMSTLVLCAPG